MHERYGEHIYSKYGFLDAFNPSFDYDVPLQARPASIPGIGWVDSDYLGIDQGPIVAMIENHRSELVWKRDAAQPAHPPRAASAPASPGGWLDAAAERPRQREAAVRCDIGGGRLARAARRSLRLLPAARAARTAARHVVSFWALGREGEVVAELLPEFERAHPGIRVEVQQIPWTAAHEKLLTAFVGDATPDLAPARQHLDPGVRRARRARAAR